MNSSPVNVRRFPNLVSTNRMSGGKTFVRML